MKDIKSMVPALKDSAIFSGWLASILLAAFLCWFLTGSIRAEFLLRSVNNVNLPGISGGEKPALQSRVPSGELPSYAGRLGSWFTINGGEGSRALVFTFFADGSFFPCMALVNRDGKVEEIFPLSVHAESMLKTIPSGTVRLHIRRIEGGES